MATLTTFGPPPNRIIGQLEIRYANGKTETINTDQDWNTNYTGILNSEIYKGEEFDARLEPRGWKEPRFSDAQWSRRRRARAARSVGRAAIFGNQNGEDSQARNHHHAQRRSFCL